jgi:hypothetical protein
VLVPPQRASERRDPLAGALFYFFHPIGPAFESVSDPVFRFVCEVFNRAFGVFISAADIAPQLLAALGGKQQSGQSARSNADQQECNRHPYASAVFVVSK